jgi:hypothetical protein
LLISASATISADSRVASPIGIPCTARAITICGRQHRRTPVDELAKTKSHPRPRKPTNQGARGDADTVDLAATLR